MAVQLPSHAVHGDGSVSVQEAASQLGCSEKTIRRRIKAGTLSAHRLPTSQGYEWRVHLNGAPDQAPSPAAVHLNGRPDQVPGTADQVDGQPIEATSSTLGASDDAPHEPLLKALGLVERLQRENMELAGRVGFLQAKLQTAEEQLLALSAGPQAPTEAPEPSRAANAEEPTPWQRFLNLFRS
jgi:excisionase family DNA binding protein